MASLTSTAPPAAERESLVAATVDWLVVLGVAAVASTGLGLEQPWDGSGVSLAVAGLALALPLAVRRTQPVLSATLVGLALAGQSWVGGTVGFGSFLAALVAVFSIGRHVARLRDALLGAVPLVVCGGIATASSIAERPAEVFFPLFYTSAAWGLGRALRVFEQRSAQLRRYNEALARDQESTARLAVAGERIRLARELHDVLAHTVMVMVWQAEEAEELLATGDPARPRDSLRNVQEAGRRGLSELRRLIDVLREDELDLPAPELSELPSLTSMLSGSGLDVALELDVPESVVLPTGLSGAVYRLVQEALTNVLRHSHAEKVAVSVHVVHGVLRCTVVDPGPRRPVPRPGTGHGLAGMEERLAPYGGTVAAGEAGAGFRVTAEVPLR